ncbi:MAG: AAA family ATPase [Methanomicrobia archaeon]|nr:AAA family ATPase [Methanomicrobia archaeon]
MISRIPPELRAALAPGAGYSLLLKGMPGTGKTMLAFEILNEFGGENAVYLSTRVSLPALYTQLPWLEARADMISVIDATKLYPSQKGFSGLRSFSDVLYEKLGEAEKTATLVIDSWEAITSEEKEEKIEELEAAITSMVRQYAMQYKMNLILISERTGTTRLDYLVDGIIEMSRIAVDNRRGREMLLEKLRGVRVDQHHYGFTLDDGRFRYFPPFERRRVEKPRRVETIPNTATHLSTGCVELDAILDGGLSKGSTAIIEYGDDLSLLGYQSIIAHMIINCIQQGTHCVVIPSSGWDERRLRRGIVPFVNEEDYLKYLTVFEIRKAKAEGCMWCGGEVASTTDAEAAEREETRANVKVLGGLSMDEDFPLFADFITHLKPPVMVIIGTDLLEFQYRLKTLGNLEEALELFSYWVMELREAGNVGVFGMPSESALSSGLGQMVTTRFKLAVLDRSVVLYCNRPDTKLHCLENVITEDTLRLALTPFV